VFGGSGVADYVAGEGVQPDGRMRPLLRAVACLLVQWERFLISLGEHAGLTDMTRHSSRAFWARMLKEHADAVPVVSPRTFFVTTTTRPGRLGLFRRALAHYLGVYYGPNDGVVVLGDQSLPGIGTTLRVLNAAHADLTQRFPAARGGRRRGRALVDSVVMAVGTPG
jgi:hypothetical protein